MAEARRSFWSETRAALRAPDLRGSLAAFLVANLNGGLLIPVVPLFLVSEGFTFVQLGGAFSLVAATSLLVQLLVARRAAAFARAGIVIPLLLLPTILLPAYLYVEGPLSFVLVMTTSALSGAIAGPALNALLARVAPDAQRAQHFSYSGVVGSFAYAAGVVAGGALYALSPVAVFYAGALLAGLAAVLSLREIVGRAPAPRPRPVDPERQAILDEAARLAAERKEADRALAKARAALEARKEPPARPVRNLRWLALYTALFGVATAVYPVFLPQRLIEAGLPLAWVGLAIASSWITYGLAQPFGARWADRTGKHREILAGSLVVVALMNLVMALGSLPFVVLGWAVLGVADGVGRPSVNALVHTHAAEGYGPSAWGWIYAAGSFARVVAPLGLALLLMGQGVAWGILLITVPLLLASAPILLLRQDAAPKPHPGGLPA